MTKIGELEIKGNDVSEVGGAFGENAQLVSSLVIIC